MELKDASDGQSRMKVLDNSEPRILISHEKFPCQLRLIKEDQQHMKTLLGE